MAGVNGNGAADEEETGSLPPADASVALDAVGKTYAGDGDGDPVRALDDVSFSVADGEFVCLVGPSGCGKTTLFRIVAGLTEATDGRVLLDGTEVTGPTTDMGVVFQEYHLFPWLTVAENVGFGLERSDRSPDERERRVDEMLELVGLTEFRDAYPKSLSGGMKQRVAIARALAVDPNLLLMDEPFGAVDAQTREMLQRELLDVWESTGKTVLFVTHDVAEAVTLADRIVVMAADPGRVREVVDVDVERPRERGDAAFAEYVGRVRELIGAGP
ncbi:ABC-type nitrate/sulfonate/bicarbonate transport system ATPase component; sulfonate ABC transporter ATP binding protein [Halorubrum sp. DM2]|uniref:ABC transporter ATP-binding protein n=1 Tax=Halorubrum sp. DM2 TaxID=2527867 RepID=UPI0024B6870F|nr:ABC transporter ATP-binding protein [Halorubrum sp. DM2]VTT85290.1 ABC-type nitrate/sulfonate/bicarbonate transport system ATPase component; sulfonate ABC transporter ATP binding protein [Halorubrum sp. DM2]